MFEIKSLKKTYHNSDGDVLALKGLDLKLGESGITFLYGKSGEGKSTLLNILSGLDDYDCGQVLYNGLDIKSMTQKQRDNYRSKEIGLIFEKENYVECLTVKQNIEIAIPLSGYKIEKDNVENSLKKVKLENFADRKLSELSSGELQRVAIARILATKPKVLFIDEPTGHLDKENSIIFWDFVKQISKDTLVVAITHEIDIIKNYADRILEIKAGEVIKDTYKNPAQKTKDEQLFKNPKLPNNTVEARASLSFKSNVKLGWRFLVKNPFRFISTLVLICLTLVIFGSSYLIGVFDSSSVLAKSTINQKLNYVSFENNKDQEITMDVLNEIYKSNTGEYFKLYTINQKMDLFGYQIVFNGMLEAVQAQNSQFNSIGQKVLYGKYPHDTDSDNRIAISDYFANLMIKHGVKYYLPGGEGVLNENSNLKDIIGKKYVIDSTKFEVVAIFETNYRDFVDEEFNIKEGCEEDFDYYFKTVYSVMHVVPNKALTIIENKISASDVNLSFKSFKAELLPNTYEIVSQDFADENSIDYSIYGMKQWLTDGEIILPVAIFNKLFKTDLMDASDLETFESAMGNNSTITVRSLYGYLEEFTVVGLTNEDRIIFANNSVSMSGRIGEIIQHCVYPVMHIVVPVESVTKLSTQIQLLSENDLSYTGRYAKSILNLTNLVSDLNIVFVVSTVFMTIFSVWLIFTFFVTFASANKRSVGALRTMGANSFNLFYIFIVSCVIIAGIGMIGGMILSVISSLILNNIISNKFGLPISVFNFDFGMFGYMFLICAIITLLGCIIPIARYCKKTPIDVVKR